MDLASDPEPAHRLGAPADPAGTRAGPKPAPWCRGSRRSRSGDPVRGDPVGRRASSDGVSAATDAGAVLGERPRARSSRARSRPWRCSTPGSGAPEEVAGEDYIAALLTDPATPARGHSTGTEDASSRSPGLDVDRLRRFLTSPDEAIRIEAVRTLGPAPCRVGSRCWQDRRRSARIRTDSRVGRCSVWPTMPQPSGCLPSEGQPTLRRSDSRRAGNRAHGSRTAS